MELIQMLTSQLGISDEQASGGAGLIFKMAKEKLGADDFSQVSSVIPDIENLISSAPESAESNRSMPVPIPEARLFQPGRPHRSQMCPETR